jgi:ribosomal protein S18 acetylase RimI-like enzyme
MSDATLFREMRAEDADGVVDLVTQTFNAFIAPGYSTEGVQHFLSGMKSERLLQLAQEGDLFLVAEIGDKIVGVISIRISDHINHIRLLFVDGEYHRRGIARQLLEKALEIRRGCDPTISEITVKSSPYALPIYGKLGFHQLGPERVENGMRFTPMVLKL